MTEARLYDLLLYAWCALGLVTFVVLLFVPAPYGRHARQGWGPTVPRTAGWIAMESPALIVFSVLFCLGARRGPIAIVFCAMWSVHYVNRTLVFPLLLRGGQRTTPLAIVGFAVLFNVVNGYLQARYLFALGPVYPSSWLTDPRMLLGGGLFFFGLTANVRADRRLRALRARHGDGYHIPRGGLFRWISCPNYFAEIVEWSGWAIATWSAPGAAFALWTAANLVPRALAHHRWYVEHLADYPAERKAIIPFVL